MAPDALSTLIGFLLSAMGGAILIVWPETGLSAWIREHLLRRILPNGLAGVLDCYICMSFWMGLGFGALWWHWTRNPMYWCGCFMVPAVFWIVLNRFAADGDVRTPPSENSNDGE